MLSHFEQRQLRAIERFLEADDPEFTIRIRTGRGVVRQRLPRYGGSIAVVGVVLLLFGILFSPQLAWLGGCMVWIGLWLRVVLPVIRREPR